MIWLKRGGASGRGCVSRLPGLPKIDEGCSLRCRRGKRGQGGFEALISLLEIRYITCAKCALHPF